MKSINCRIRPSNIEQFLLPAGSGTSDCNLCQYVSMPSGVLPGSGVDIGFAGFGEAVIQKIPSWNQSNA